MHNLFFYLLLTVSLILFSGCGGNAEEETHSGENHAERTHANESSVISLTKHQVEHIGVKISNAEIKDVAAPLILSGKAAFNESLTAHITSRARGRIEKVHAVISDRVAAGEILLELYSQDFLAMQSELLQAEERLNRINNKNNQEYRTAESIYESAVTKLEAAGLSKKEIQGIAAGKSPLKLLPVRAPFSGTLISGGARLGEFVETGKDLFMLANLQSVWVLADVFEKDLTLVKEGITGIVTPSSYPQDSIKARLSRVYDVVDPSLRTVKVRFEVQNAAGKLKPEMFVSVKINSVLGGKSLKVPASSIIKEKEKAYLFVADNDTTFSRREIMIGKETKEFAEIISGLKEDEKVVTSGTFYLKSELAKETFMEDKH